jgi:hypothetical protein
MDLLASPTRDQPPFFPRAAASFVVAVPHFPGSAMERPTFEKELSKYKIVRLADHYKIRWKPLSSKRTAERAKLPPSSGASAAAGKPVSAPTDPFWTMIERVNVNALSESEMKKFLAALREEHAQIVSQVNLEDLEYMAKKL